MKTILELRQEMKGGDNYFRLSGMSRQDRVFGDRTEGSEVNNANPYKFSYPGYNEIFTGYPDPGVNSNDKIKNPNNNYHC